MIHWLDFFKSLSYAIDYTKLTENWTKLSCFGTSRLMWQAYDRLAILGMSHSQFCAFSPFSYSGEGPIQWPPNHNSLLIYRLPPTAVIGNLKDKSSMFFCLIAFLPQWWLTILRTSRWRSCALSPFSRRSESFTLWPFSRSSEWQSCTMLKASRHFNLCENWNYKIVAKDSRLGKS